MVRPSQPELQWWQKVLVRAKVWQPRHRTSHHAARDLPAPTPPPVTGAYGNQVVNPERPRRVPQRDA